MSIVHVNSTVSQMTQRKTFIISLHKALRLIASRQQDCRALCKPLSTSGMLSSASLTHQRHVLPRRTCFKELLLSEVGQHSYSYRQCQRHHWSSPWRRPTVTPHHHHPSGVTVSGDFTIPSRFISKKTYEFPELSESDLEEQFVRGSGPGGQSVNKTSNCVVLKHIPSGLQVKSHETRSLDTNRKIARQKLREALDVHINEEDSFLEQKKKLASINKKAKKSKAKKILDLKKEFKERTE